MSRLHHHHIQPMLYGTVLLLVMGGLLWFSIESERQMRGDFAVQLSAMENSLDKQLLEITDQINQNLDILGARVSTLAESLEDNKVSTLEHISELSSTIESTRQESLSVLTKLQDNVKMELDSLEAVAGDFSNVIENAIPAVASIATNKGLGSGAIVDETGFIITNYHVVDDVEQIWVQMSDKSVYPAQIIAKAAEHDLALLKVASNGPFEKLTLGSVTDVKVGERVIALGSPAGLGFTATQGIISAKNRVGPNGQSNYLQMDVPINPGNSGGPVLTSSGKVVGIANFKLKEFEGLGFAIQIDVVRSFIQDVIAQLS